MQSFFVAKTRPTHQSRQQKVEDEEVDLSWVLKTINKASLQVQDIRMKLDLAKVIKFLEKPVEIERKRSHIVTFCPSPANSQEHIPSSNHNKLNGDFSEINLMGSRSVLSQELSSFLTINNPQQSRNTLEVHFAAE